MRKRGEAPQLQPESDELSLELDSSEMEVSPEAETHVRVDGIPEVDAEGNHIEGKTVGESQEMDFDYLNTKLVDAYINEIELPEMGEIFAMARFKKGVNAGAPTIGVPIPERLTFLTEDQIKAKREVGEEPVYYEMKMVLGQGGMGMAVEAEAVDEHGEEIKGMKPIVVKFAFDMNNSVVQRRVVRETALHAVLNPDEEAAPDLSHHLQASYKGTRPRDKVKHIPAFGGAVKYSVPAGNVYVVGMERVPGYDLTEYSLAQYYMPMAPAMKSMLSVAETLADLHDRGILHRDIKPANIMGDMKEPENTMLIDMGLSKDVFQEMIETTDASMLEKVHEATFYEAKINQLLGEAGRVAPLDLKVKLEDEMIKFRKAAEYKNVLEMEDVLEVLEGIYGELVEPDQQEKVPKTDTSIPSQITEFGVAVGTPYYMNASVIRGESDPLNDVHALAATYLHMSKGARFNHSTKISEVVDRVQKGEFIEPYDPDSDEYKRLCHSESDREFVELMNEMIKEPTPTYLYESQQRLESGQALEVIDFTRFKEYFKWMKKERAKQKRQLSGLEQTLLALSEEINAFPKEAPKQMRDEAEPLVREYFEQFTDWQIQQRGMREVVRRLKEIVAKNEAVQAAETIEFQATGT